MQATAHLPQSVQGTVPALRSTTTLVWVGGLIPLVISAQVGRATCPAALGTSSDATAECYEPLAIDPPLREAKSFLPRSDLQLSPGWPNCTGKQPGAVRTTFRVGPLLLLRWAGKLCILRARRTPIAWESLLLPPPDHDPSARKPGLGKARWCTGRLILRCCVG